VHIATEGRTVLVERIDRFTRVETGEHVELQVTGAGEVDSDGKIINWRDYFPLTPPPAELP
jgi:limonene-1,2-epoxide hydrolase